MDQARNDPPASPAEPLVLTPMMAQYFEIKAINPGYLLFYRMGDFYELFFEDAEIASQALGIVLTKRGKHLGQDIRMCGVPIHAANDYLNKLIRLGHRVALCEQVEDPAEAKKRGGKSVVKRDVVRLITPGTLTEDDHLQARSANYLAALAMLRHGETDFALAWADVSTGETACLDLSAEALQDELARIDPAELLLTDATRAMLLERHLLPPSMAGVLSLVPAEVFDSEGALAQLKVAFPADIYDPSVLTRAARAALGALVAYVGESQKGLAPVVLRPPSETSAARHMAIDQATRSSLEILVTQRGQGKGSLRDAIDLTVTGPGSRLLAARLAAPLCDAGEINQRLDAVSMLVDNGMLAARLRADLKSVPDLARALTRLALDRGGPRDLAAIGVSVSAALALSAHFHSIETPSPILDRLNSCLAAAPRDLASELALAINDEPPLLARDGGFVRKGYDAKLDGERALASQTRDVVAALQSRLIEETEVKSLKIRHNGVLGYFVEVPAGHGARLLEEPLRATFIHRQTLANAMRFTTAELADLEGHIARAHEAALDLETKIFSSLRYAVLSRTDALRELADALAELDVTTALAHL
ncbi:MAG TPA: DNA mismatch repair protein MutS, partial [Devosia sp.]|nr:DNA mismatch repair protein MutS [Devosia sp.]